VIAIREYLRTLGANMRGATAIEYGLIAALIAVALVSSLKALGGGAGGMWSNLSNITQNSM
jgi:pilus assembly protein Flp/PilA